MKKMLFAVLFAASFGAAAAPTVYNGHWNNLAESGRGMNIDHQDGVLVVDFYGYNADGSAQWYQAAGPTSMSSKGEVTFSGKMSRFKNGPCFTCSPQKPVELNGDDGTISIVFTTPVRAEVTLPGGHKTTMTPYYFGITGDISNMKGYWYFNTTTNTTYSSSLVQFTSVSKGVVAGKTHAGNTIGCQLGDSTVGTVEVCIEYIGTSSTVKMYYALFPGIDKSYGGSASPNSNFSPEYVFDAFRKIWPSGNNLKAADSDTTDVGLSSEQKELLEQFATNAAPPFAKP